MSDVLYLVDVFSLVFQVYHGVAPMTGPQGQPTNAVFGFARDLQTLLDRHRPTHLVCALDSPEPAARNEIYPLYKANRSEMPVDLRPQIPVVKDLIAAFRVPAVQHAGWEADDVIATLADRAERAGFDVRIVSSDKDCRQLLSPRVLMYNVRKDTFYDESALRDEWGIRPDQVVDFQSLVGDAVDNVPGVPLVGPKKAQALLEQFGPLEQVLAAADQVKQAKLRENLVAHADLARVSRQLVELNRHLPLEFDLDRARVKVPDWDALVALADQCGFRRLRDQWATARRSATEPGAAAASGSTNSSPTSTATSAPSATPRTRGLFDGLDDDAPPHDAPVPSAAPPRSVESSTPAKSQAASGDPAVSDSAAPLEPAISPTTPASQTPAASLSIPAPRTWHVVDTPEAFADLVAALHPLRSFCLDLETTGLDAVRADIVGWALCWMPGEAYYVPVRGPAGERTLDPEAVVAALRPILEDPAVEIANQNVKYDLLVLRRAGIRVANVGLDPMVADYLLDAGDRSRGLDRLAEKYLDHRMIDISELIGKGKTQRRMDEVPIARVAEYASDDADTAWRLADRLGAALRREGLWDLYWDLERPLIPVLTEMEWTGIRVDADELRRQGEDLGRRLEELIGEIHAIAGREFQITSPIQLRAVLFDELKLPVLKKTKTGASTDQDVLERLAPLHALPAKIIEHRQLSKLKGTYLDALPELVNPETGRIHASFNQVVAATGRLSSSDPNLQNIPVRTAEGRRIRRAFTAAGPLRPDGTPEPGWELVCADYSQIELRMLAHFSADPALTAAFESGADIHASVAAEVFRTAPADVTSDMRRLAKAVNFGVIYGQSAFGLAAALGIPQDEAQAFIDDYFRRYARVAEYLGELLRETSRTGWARTILGRRRAIQGVRPDAQGQLNMAERTAVNTTIQGSAADLIKQAMIRIFDRLQAEGHPARMLLQIHDELVFETPAARRTDLVALVRQEMEHAFELKVPLVVDVAAGPNWLDVAEC